MIDTISRILEEELNYVYCDSCKHDMDYDAEYEQHDYCPVCGQKILWEEE